MLTFRASRASWGRWRCRHQCRQSSRGLQGWRQRGPRPSWRRILRYLPNKEGWRRQLTRRKCWGWWCCLQREQAWCSRRQWPRFPSGSGVRRGCRRRRRWWGWWRWRGGWLRAPDWVMTHSIFMVPRLFWRVTQSLHIIGLINKSSTNNCNQSYSRMGHVISSSLTP